MVRPRKNLSKLHKQTAKLNKQRLAELTTALEVVPVTNTASEKRK